MSHGKLWVDHRKPEEAPTHILLPDNTTLTKTQSLRDLRLIPLFPPRLRQSVQYLRAYIVTRVLVVHVLIRVLLVLGRRR